MKFGVGQAVKRLEDQALITGGGRFTDDFKLANAAHAYILRSPHAHARIVRLDTSKAKKAKGVLAVLIGADVEADGLGLMPCMIPMTSRDGKPRYDTPRPVLAKDRVRHVGDPVALVVAETLLQARDAAEKIELDYEELPHAVETYAAAQPGAPRVWEHIPNNIAFDWEKGDRAGVEAALKSADRVIKLRIVNNRVVVNSMEARACLGDYDAATDRVTLYTSCQSVGGLRNQLADAIFKIPKEKVRVVSGHVGGGFGMKLFLHPETVLMPWAARRLKRAVRWAADRSEGFQSDIQGRDHVSFAELALDKDAKFLALKVETYANEGAYLSNYAPFVATGGSDMHVGLYTTAKIYTRVAGIVTNTVPIDAYRGAGRPEAAYLIERLVDHAARETGLTPHEIRKRNFIPPAAMPYQTPLGDVFDSGEFQACMEQAMKLADWDGFEKRKKASAAKGKLRGRGLATYIERCGGGAPETAIAKFDPKKKEVTLYIGNQDNGQAHVTSYTQIVSSALDLDAKHIKIVQGDTDLVPHGLTGGSRALPVGGAAMLGVSDKVKAKGKEVASRLLEAAVEDIEYKDGQFRIVGTDRRASLWDVAAAANDPKMVPDGAAAGLDEQFVRQPEAATFPNGCHIIEVEVDPDTGSVHVDRYTVVDDFGAVINPLTLASQVHGGIVQGLGQALHEYTVYDAESGQLVTGSFMDYNMPKADAFPFFKFETRNVRCTTNPLGVKGSGEAGCIGAPPAVINALVDALAPYGIKHIDMPATPRAIWEAIQAVRPRAAAE
jgi:carbon-monoxide dehydrogenase large subunit